MILVSLRRSPSRVATRVAYLSATAGQLGDRRSGMTLAELLVATSVTALIVATLGVFMKAVMDGCEQASKSGTAAQAGRVVTARIAHKVSTARQVLKLSDGVRNLPEMDQVLLLWERDAEPDDTAPGQPNLVELIIYARNKESPTQLLELRPQVAPSIVVPLDDQSLLYPWIERFRSGQDIVQPPVALLNDLSGLRFDVEEIPEPQGIGGVVQQNVRIVLCISLPDQEPAVFFGSATRRYVTAK